MAETGRQVMLKEYGKPLVIEEFPVPDPEPGAVIMRITQAGICGTDLRRARAGEWEDAMPPSGIAMGHEGNGVVHKLGEGVTADFLGNPLHEGDRIIHAWGVPCNQCHMCLRGESSFCVNRITRPAGEHPYFVGTHADYFHIRPGQAVFRVPDELSDDAIGPVNCAMGTVTQGLLSAGTGQGQYVVIMGAGGLGLSGTAMAKDMGADRVIVLDRLENRLQLAEEMGADFTVNIDEYNTPETRIRRIKELTRGRGADVVVEVVGRPHVLQEGIQMLAHGGTFVEIGHGYSGQTMSFDPSTIVLTGKRIIGSFMYKPMVVSTLLDFLVRNQGKRPFDRVVSHKFKLADVNEAFAEAEWTQRDTQISRAALVP